MTFQWQFRGVLHLILQHRSSALLQQLHIIAFTHRQLDVSKIGLLHIEKEAQIEALSQLQALLDLKELMFFTTCNRVEITLVNAQELDTPFLTRLLQTLYPKLVPIQLEEFVRKAEIYTGSAAVQHALSVASSIDSMIIGEREIITQVRLAYEYCNELNLTGSAALTHEKSNRNSQTSLYRNQYIYQASFRCFFSIPIPQTTQYTFRSTYSDCGGWSHQHHNGALP